MSVKPIPDGYHSITPYIVIDGAADAIRFYQQAFGATEVFRMPAGDRIGHAELKIGDSHFMLADSSPQWNTAGPGADGHKSFGLMIYVDDPDATFQRAVDLGAKVDRPVENQFYGDRSGTLIDPFGHKWTVAKHVEDVSPDELQRRLDAMMNETA